MALMFLGNWRGCRPFTETENSGGEREYLRGESGRREVGDLRTQLGTC